MNKMISIVFKISLLFFSFLLNSTVQLKLEHNKLQHESQQHLLVNHLSYKDNLAIQNYYYGNMTNDQYRVRIFQATKKSTTDKLTQCPLDTPFVTADYNSCQKCSGDLPLRNLQKFKCQSCPTGQKYDQNKGNCTKQASQTIQSNPVPITTVQNQPTPVSPPATPVPVPVPTPSSPSSPTSAPSSPSPVPTTITTTTTVMPPFSAQPNPTAVKPTQSVTQPSQQPSSNQTSIAPTFVTPVSPQNTTVNKTNTQNTTKPVNTTNTTNQTKTNTTNTTQVNTTINKNQSTVPKPSQPVTNNTTVANTTINSNTSTNTTPTNSSVSPPASNTTNNSKNQSINITPVVVKNQTIPSNNVAGQIGYNCSDKTPKYNKQTKACEACPQNTQYIAQSNTCLEIIYSNNLKKAKNIIQPSPNYFKELNDNITKQHPTRKIRQCPDQKPYLSRKKGSYVCLSCKQNQYYFVETQICRKGCPRGTIFDETNMTCKVGQYLTNPDIDNLVSPNGKYQSWKQDVTKLQGKGVNVKFCPSDKPFQYNNKCLACTNQQPLFNIESGTCTSCGRGRYYSRQSRKCQAQLVNKPSLTRMIANIF